MHSGGTVLADLQAIGPQDPARAHLSLDPRTETLRPKTELFSLQRIKGYPKKLLACDQGDVVHFQCAAVSNTQQTGGIVNLLSVVRNNLGLGPNICFPRFASIGDSRVISFVTSPFVPLLCDRRGWKRHWRFRDFVA